MSKQSVVLLDWQGNAMLTNIQTRMLIVTVVRQYYSFGYCSSLNIGTWPSVTSRRGDIDQVLVFVCLLTELRARSINMHKKKKNETDIPPSWSHAWTIGDLSYGFCVNNDARVTGNPERARKTHLDRQVANQGAGFASSCSRAL